VVAGFAATGITMVSLTSLGVLCSVYARKSRDAILLSYLCLIGYLGIGYLVQQVAALPSAKTPLAPGIGSFTLGDVVKAFNAGNLLFVLADLQSAWTKGAPLSDLVSAALRSHMIFHAVVAVICVSWAVWRFRTAAMRQAVMTQARAGRARSHPRIARRPMVWKEVFVEPGFRLSRIGRVVLGIFVLVSFVPAIWLLGTGVKWVGTGPYWTALDRALSPWIRATGTILGCLMLVAVAARASTSISGERDRETLDGLLTSPLQSHDILFAKWLGSLLSVRWGWAWIGAIWLIGLATRAIHPAVIPLTFVAWLVYASTLAGVGLWFSTACRTSLRAILWTLTTTVVLCGGQYVLSMCCLPCIPPQSVLGEFSGIVTAFTPVSVFYELAATRQQVRGESWQLWMIMVYFGLFMWALGALSLWTFTRSRFRRITARMPYRRLEGRRGVLRDAWGELDEFDGWQEYARETRSTAAPQEPDNG
jgi:ABC-type transport system involved in multi-copper enzyme maturation permease subunit